MEEIKEKLESWGVDTYWLAQYLENGQITIVDIEKYQNVLKNKLLTLDQLAYYIDEINWGIHTMAEVINYREVWEANERLRDEIAERERMEADANNAFCIADDDWEWG